MVQKYVFPDTIPQAVSILADSKGKARIIAGGTDLVLDIRDGKFSAETLVDLSNVEGLNRIEEVDGNISIGANVTHTQIVKSELIQKHAPGLVDACRKIGSLQIRNVATVVGNVVTGNPAADSAVALACLDTTATVIDINGTRIVPFSEMYAGICLSCINSCCHIVTHLTFPKKQKGHGSAYLRMEQRNALSLPMLNVSAKVSVVDNVFEWAQILIAPVGAGPQHAVDAENFLQNMTVTDDNIKKAAALAKNQAKFRSSSVRGSKEYRMGILPVFVERVLHAALVDAIQA